jgi:hypothetical protein
MDSQAWELGMSSGKAKSAGKASAKLAPNWLPVDETSGGKLGMNFFVKLPEMA